MRFLHALRSKEEEMLRSILIFSRSDELRAALLEGDPREVEVEGQDVTRFRREVEAADCREGKCFPVRHEHRDPGIRFGRHLRMILEVIHEKIPATMGVGPHCRAKALCICWYDQRLIRRQLWRGGCKLFLHALDEVIDSPQHVIVRTALTELTERRLIIVGKAGHPKLTKPAPAAFGIKPAVIDICSHDVRAIAEDDRVHRAYARWWDNRTVPVVLLHPAANLAAGIRHAACVELSQGLFVGLVPHVAEDEIRRAFVGRLPVVLPSVVGVAAKHGNEAIGWKTGIAPTGAGPKSRGEPDFFCEFQEQLHVAFPSCTGSHPFRIGKVGCLPRCTGGQVFVLHLNADDRTAIREKGPLGLLEDFPVKPLDMQKIARVVGADLVGFPIEPVGHAAIAHLAMTERPNP